MKMFLSIIIVGCYSLSFTVVGTTRLTAINLSAHTKQLYQQLRNRNVPAKTDPATSSAFVRQKTCEDITRSGYFERINLIPVDLRKVYHNQNHPRYTYFFFQMYKTTSSRNFYEYTNSYKSNYFAVPGQPPTTEYVFVCSMKDLSKNKTRFIYISKLYDLGKSEKQYKPGRFIFGNFSQGLLAQSSLMLAEEPASVYEEESFNIEAHYLRIRKYISLMAKDNETDPLCSMVSREPQDPKNQHRRLCVAALTSTRFKDRVRYPQPAPRACQEEKISFRTVRKMAGETYYERMTLCYSAYVNPLRGACELYISRAYLSDQLFIYIRDPSDGKIYLEGLITNIIIADELNSFEFVED